MLQIPRQQAIAKVLMFCAMAAMFYVLYSLFHPMIFGGKNWGLMEYFAIGNLVVLYVGVFELMTHTPIGSWKVLAGWLIAPLVIMAIWFPSMYLWEPLREYGEEMGKTNPLGGIALLLGMYLYPLWPVIVSGLLTRTARGV